MTSDWDRLAPLYRLQETLEWPALDAAIAATRPDPDDVVVALGCGPGTLARALARTGRHVARLIGVDASSAMLERATAAGMEAVRADVTAVPLATHAADLVVAGYVLHLLSATDRRAGVAEAARLVRPDGLVAMVVPARPPGRVGRALRATLRPVAGATLSVPDDLDEAVAAAGLVVVADRVVGTGRWGYVSRVLVASSRPAQRSPQP